MVLGGSNGISLPIITHNSVFYSPFHGDNRGSNPLPEDIKVNVIEWHEYLKILGFKDNDPLFPVIDNRFTETNLLRQTMRKDEIKSDTTIRDIFKKAFERA